MALLGPDGRPISSSSFKNKKATPPEMGEKYGSWGGPNVSIMNMPGGGAIQFDLDALQLGDFRQMRDHYQINSSLSLLMFLMHQMEWRVTSGNKKHDEFYTEALDNIWTPLVRSKSQAFWAGYSPNVLNWENDTQGRRVMIDKIKDLIPEESVPRWKKVGEKTNPISVYDGIHQIGSKPIPVDNSYWYPLLMENGNYMGRKLLRSAFQPWFFSILLHLFANRYYERFGEPTPIGRAPYDDDITFQGKTMTGNRAMEQILSNLRNRAVVVLPNDKTPVGDENSVDYDYQIEYLESQMRGADFERYMTRLDEEMSLGLFTPILMMRTADVGSYNLGTQHTMTYQWMLNAISGDWKHYIDWYILRPLRNWNFGERAPLPKIQFRRQGAQNEELVRDIVRALVAKGEIKPDMAQLGEIAGLKLEEVEQLTEPIDKPGGEDDDDQPGDPTQPSQAANSRRPGNTGRKENAGGVASVIDAISERIEPQVASAMRRNKLRNTQFDLGFQSRTETAFREEGWAEPEIMTVSMYGRFDALLFRMCTEDYDSPEKFVSEFNRQANKIADSVKREF